MDRKLTFVISFAVTLTVLAVGLPVAQGAPAREMSDKSITDAVEDQFLFDWSVPYNEIDVRTNEGIVTLTGTVGNLLAKDRAARIAETIKGVRSVINRIQVEPAEDRSDKDIRDDVIAALAYDPAADSYELDVKVEDNVVTLSGKVQSWQEKQLARKVAKGVNGVTGLKDAINVNYKTDRPDPEIQADIEQALKWDTLVDHGLITVNVDDGKVKLSGTVGSSAEKRQARHNAWVAGVTDVTAEALTVREWAEDEDIRKTRFAIKSPDQIEEAIKDALLYDPRAFSFNIQPDVAGSVVTLRGKVDNMLAKEAAAQVARNTVGVNTVINRIKIRSDKDMSDSEIAANVRKALKRDPYVDRYEITTAVVNGTAYLYGTVDTFFEKGQAYQAAAAADGVAAVRSNLDVEYTDRPLAYDPYVYDYYPYDYDWYDYEPFHTFRSDSAIKEEISDELWWSPFVDSDQVKVSVDNGVATLTGKVDSWSELEAARQNAYEGGATWVINKLDVKDQK
ncbi:MAG: BON domain-containing protein [Phycisphaerae bacterium]